MSGSRACSPSRGRRPFRALRADAGGATSVEFGLISGVLFALLFGITDFGYAFWQWSSAAKALQLGVRPLARHLGAEPPDFELPVPVYFVTLIDKRHIVNSDQEYSEDWVPYDLWKIGAAYSDALFGLNHLGMLDVALYVSTQRTHGVDRFLQFHTHSLVWGIKERKLAEHWQEWIGKCVRCFRMPAR